MIWNNLHLGSIFSVCSTVAVECDCPDNIDGVFWVQRALFMFVNPGFFMFLGVFFYYQDHTWKTIAYMYVVWTMSCILCLFFFRRELMATQILMCVLSVTLFWNIGFYYIGGVEEIKRNMLKMCMNVKMSMTISTIEA